MKANELRIGNYVHRQSGKMVVNRDDVYKIENINLQSALKYEPIPLTEEWLLKFGFEKEDFKNYNRWKDDNFQLEILGESYAYYLWGGESAPFLTQFIGHCKYIHQLQNLYFALTGEELKLN